MRRDSLPLGLGDPTQLQPRMRWRNMARPFPTTALRAVGSLASVRLPSVLQGRPLLKQGYTHIHMHTHARTCKDTHARAYFTVHMRSDAQMLKCTIAHANSSVYEHPSHTGEFPAPTSVSIPPLYFLEPAAVRAEPTHPQAKARGRFP